MRATFAYTTARILLFVAATGLCYLAGARGLLLLALALLISGSKTWEGGRTSGSATRCPARW